MTFLPRLLIAAALLTSTLCLGSCSADAPEPITCAVVATPGLDPDSAAVQQHRDNFDHVVFLFGDSISRGFGLRVWADEMDRGNALWELRSPSSMINMMLRDSGIRQERDACGVLSAAANVAVYAGRSGQPLGGEEAAARLRDLVQRRIIRAGDVVVLEDARDVEERVHPYAANWILVREALRDTGVTVIMMTMPEMEINRPLRDDHGASFNDATRQAAAHAVNGAPAVLIDMEAALRSFDQRATQFGVLSLQSDELHPNVWGQCVIAASVLRAAGAESHAWPSMSSVLREHSRLLTDTATPNPPGAESAEGALRACAATASAATLERH